MSKNMWCVTRLLPQAPAILDVIACKTGGRPVEIAASENNIYLSRASSRDDALECRLLFFSFSLCPFLCWLDPSRTSVPPLEGSEAHQTAQTLSSGIRPHRTLPPVIADRIMDNDSHRDPSQEGGHYADMPDESWTQTSPRWLTMRRGW